VAGAHVAPPANVLSLSEHGGGRRVFSRAVDADATVGEDVDVDPAPRGDRTHARGVAWALALVFVGWTSPSPAQDDGARRAFDEGVLLEKKSDYAAALLKFRESAAIKPTLGNRFHAAYCLEMTGKLANALEQYEAVEKAAREQQKTDVGAQTRARLEPLRARVPQIAVRIVSTRPGGVAEEGAGVSELEVFLDETTIAPALLDGRSFRVDPGAHAIVARAPGYHTFRKELTLAEGSSAAVDVALVPMPVAPAPPPSSNAEPAPPPGETRRTLAIATAGGAIVLAGLGVAAFVVAGGKQSDAEAACPTRVSCEREQAGVRAFDTLALASFVGAAGLAALSVVLFVSPSRPRAPAASVTARGSWVGVEGRF
jgi:hypothetical protein